MFYVYALYPYKLVMSQMEFMVKASAAQVELAECREGNSNGIWMKNMNNARLKNVAIMKTKKSFHCEVWRIFRKAIRAAHRATQISANNSHCSRLHTKPDKRTSQISSGNQFSIAPIFGWINKREFEKQAIALVYLATISDKALLKQGFDQFYDLLGFAWRSQPGLCEAYCSAKSSLQCRDERPRRDESFVRFSDKVRQCKWRAARDARCVREGRASQMESNLLDESTGRLASLQGRGRHSCWRSSPLWAHRRIHCQRKLIKIKRTHQKNFFLHILLLVIHVYFGITNGECQDAQQENRKKLHFFNWFLFFLLYHSLPL